MYLTAILEYVAAEILELAGNAARESKPSRVRINPRDVMLGKNSQKNASVTGSRAPAAIRQDEDLNSTFDAAIIPGAGVVQHIHSALTKPSKKAKKKSES